MKIVFTRHAREKFEMLRRHKFRVTEQQVREAVKNPEILDYSRLPLLIVQHSFDRTHVLRVVYKRESNAIKIITFYPGRKSQYENKET